MAVTKAWDSSSSTGPYDAIHVGAAAELLPPHLLAQLKVGGCMVIPVGCTERQELVKVVKQADGFPVQEGLTAVRFVHLTTKEEQLRTPPY